MKKWNVSIPWFASVNVTVDAETKQDAIDKAYDEADSGLCHQCNDRIEMGDCDTMTEPSAEEIKS